MVASYYYFKKSENSAKPRLAEATSSTPMSEVKLKNLNKNQLRQNLIQLEEDLKAHQLKDYGDFSKELQIYNQLVRKQVQIKKQLFFKKYAHWISI